MSGKRKLETFADFSKARKRADSINNSVADGNVEALNLTRHERIAFFRCKELIEPYGVEIDQVGREWADAKKLLGTMSLVDAAKEYAARHSKLKPQKVEALVSALVAEKQADKLADEYAHDLKVRLGRFAEAFNCPIHTITAEQINEFLRTMPKVGERSRNNYRRAIVTLICYAETKHAIQEGAIRPKDIARAKESARDIEGFTPEEMKKLLKAAQVDPKHLPSGYNKRWADPEQFQGVLPLLVLVAFGAMRAKEVSRQKWSDINLETGFIRVTGVKGGTSEKRLIPIRDNLRAWLKTIPRVGTTCCTYDRHHKALESLAKRAGVTWKRNALRHSYATYRIAETQDVEKTSLESGDSSRIIRKN